MKPLKWLFALGRRPSRPASFLSRTRHFRPSLEVLECRLALSTGGLDLSFGSRIFNFTAGTRDESAAAVAVQADGRYVVAGSASNGSDFDFAVARFNRDGSLDSSFGTGGKTTVAFNLGGGNNDKAFAVAVQADGKIVVAGEASTTSQGTNFAVCRLTSTGALDTSFNTTGKFNADFSGNDSAHDVALSGTGIVVAGTAHPFSSDDFAVIKLTAAGALDNTFSTDGKQTVAFDLGGGGTNNDTCAAVVVRPDGVVILGGSVSLNATATRFGLAALDTSGNLATGFGFQAPGIIHYAPGGTDGVFHLTDLALQPNNKVVTAGFFDGPNGHDMVVNRLNANLGSNDGLFGPASGTRKIAFDFGGTNNDEANAVAVQEDGKVLIAGTIDSGSDRLFASARLLANGELDPSFGSNGKSTQTVNISSTLQAQCFGMALSPEGIVLVGESETAASGLDFAAVRVVRDQLIVATADQGGPPTVRLLTPTGTVLRQFDAYGAAFTGGVRVASADVTGDQYPDILCAPGPGGAPFVNVFNGLTLDFVRTILVYGDTFTGGVNLAVDDVRSTAGLELITAPDTGGAPFVNIFSLSDGSFQGQIQAFGASFTLGLRVATGQAAGDALKEIFVAPQAGGSPFVNIFNATSGAMIRSIQVFDSSFTGGVFLATANVNNNATTDLIVGPGSGLPIVRVFESNDGSLLDEFLAFPTASTDGVKVSTLSVDAAGGIDLVAGRGKNGTPEIRFTDLLTGTRLGTILAFDVTMTAGIFVVGVAR